MENLFVKGISQTYTYGEKGINHLSFEMKKGEAVAVCGGEKAGKTTLLKILAGLLPYEGEILFDGTDAKKLTPEKRNVFMCFKNEGFFNNKSVRYNLEYPLTVRGMSKKEAGIKVLESAEYYGITHLLDTVCSALRARDRAKVAVTRALNRNACLYLFDDPFYGLTYEEKHETLLKFSDMVKDLPMVVFSTSDIDEARTVCDKLLLLDYSVTADFGDIDTLKKRPLTYTAMNIMEAKRVNTIEGILRKDKEGYFVTFGAVVFRYPACIKLISDEFVDKKVKVAFSPEDTKIGKGTIRMIAIYAGRESVGGRMQSIFTLGGQRIVADGGYPGMKYSEALLSVEPEALKLFDAASENTIIA